MAAAFRTSTGSATAGSSSTTQDSPSIALQSGDTVYVLVASSDGTPVVPSSVIWDPGVANESLTSINDSTNWSPSGPYGRTTVWRAQNLTAKTAVFRATWGSAQGERVVVVWVGTGINTTTPNGTIVATTGTATSVSSGNATTTTGQLVVGFAHLLDISGTATTLALNSPNGTERTEVFTGTSFPYDCAAVQDISAGGSTQAITWTAGGTSANYEGFRAIAIPLNDASSGYTITADGGSFTYTGTAASLERGYLLTANSGTYTLTGADAFRDFSMVASGGTYTLTGATANFRKGFTMVANSGSFTYTGTDVTLKIGRLLSAVSGTYTLIGDNTTLTYSGTTYLLSAESGTFSLTGTQVGLLAQRKITADVGTYTFTGSDVTLSKTNAYRITSESGIYSYVGSSVNLIYSGAPLEGSGFMNNAVTIRIGL